MIISKTTKTLTVFLFFLTTVALLNSIFQLFNIQNILGAIFTGLSVLYLPAGLMAMLVTNNADSPDLWGMILGYSTQGVIMFIILKRIFFKKNDT